jgi:hypothetical protein
LRNMHNFYTVWVFGIEQLLPGITYYRTPGETASCRCPRSAVSAWLPCEPCLPSPPLHVASKHNIRHITNRQREVSAGYPTLCTPNHTVACPVCLLQPAVPPCVLLPPLHAQRSIACGI